MGTTGVHVSTVPGGEDGHPYTGGGGGPLHTGAHQHPWQPSSSDQDGAREDAATSGWQQKETPRSLPRPQFRFRKKEASAESSDIARCANVEADLSGIGEVFKSKPHPGHTHSVWLHISQISDGGANETDTKMAAANTLANLSTASVPHTNLNLTRNPPPPMADMTSLPGPGCVPISLQSSLPPSRPTSGASGSYDSESYQVPDGLKIKDEPDDRSLSGSEYGSEEMMRSPPNTGVSNTGMSPIDMETQEKIKLDRKRMRNRLAASKCRKRKLERISQLDERVAALKNENADLAAVVKKMKAGVALLKQEVIEHVNSGCEIRMTDSGTY